MIEPPQLADCTFSTVTTDDGRFTGRCTQYPELRTRPHRRSLDALDEIISVTATKIAQLNETLPYCRGCGAPHSGECRRGQR